MYNIYIYYYYYHYIRVRSMSRRIVSDGLDIGLTRNNSSQPAGSVYANNI